MKKIRLDLLLVERGLVDSRSLAQRLVMAGQVRVNGQVALKPSVTVLPDAALVIDQGPPYVSRGGEKLAAAVQAWGRGAGLVIEGRVCADVGASTGGFTDCLLQNGASRVYAIDVGEGILHWKLRQDPRVVVMEGTNARHVTSLPEPIELVTIDASFISLKIILPVIGAWFPENSGNVVALIKPQFEAGRQIAARAEGVIRDPAVHRQVLLDVLAFAREQSYSIRGLIRSPLQGPKGNTEFLTWLSRPANTPMNLEELVDGALSSPN